MHDIGMPYGPRRAELQAMAAKHNASRRGKKYPIDFVGMNRAELMAALGVTVVSVRRSPG